MRAANLLNLFAAALLILLSACAPHQSLNSAPASTAIPSPIITDMPLIRGLPSVDVRINGRGPFRLIIDTGAEAVFLSTAAAHDACLPLNSGAAPFYATDGTLDRVAHIALARIALMEIQSHAAATSAEHPPAAAFRGFDAIVRDIPVLSQSAGRRIDGLIGTSILRTGVWTLNYSFQQLTIAPASDPPRESMGAVQLIPVGPKENLYGLRAHIDGQTFDLLLDTGSVDAITLGKTDVARLLACPDQPILRPIGARDRSTYFDTATHAVYQLGAPIRFGEIEWSGREVIEAATTSSIGSGAMSSLTIDLAHQQATLRQSSCTPIPAR